MAESGDCWSVLLSTVYDLYKCGREDYAIDVIFRHMDNLFVERNFEACDLILHKVNIKRISVVLMISFLTITAAYKADLKSRKLFYRCVKRLIIKERGEVVARRLLDGLG